MLQQDATERGHNALLMFGSSVDENYEAVDIKQEHRRSFSGMSPMINSANLTPERFQQPVKMLNSLQHGQLLSPATGVSGNDSNSPLVVTSSWSGHVTSVTDHMDGALNQQMMSPFGTRLEMFGKGEKRRRTSSTSGPPLDDQGRLEMRKECVCE